MKASLSGEVDPGVGGANAPLALILFKTMLILVPTESLEMLRSECQEGIGGSRDMPSLLS